VTAAVPADWSRPKAVWLVSCYELGRQPFNLASPWAQLEAAGFGVAGIDTAIDDLAAAPIEQAKLVAVSVPMHTALRLGVELARAIRLRAPQAHICFFGLYAALNAELLLEGAADSVLGGEFERALVALARSLALEGAVDAAAEEAGVVASTSRLRALGGGRMAPPVLDKLTFAVPERAKLAPLARYATFFGPSEGEQRMVGYVEASRGCRHRCRHCPVTPVYQGRFFVVPEDVVLADAEQQIGAGAGHITFGDPDFFNGPKHGMRILRALHERHPEVSFDVTIKIEHLLARRELVVELGRLGCAFVVSAVESLSDDVLARLDKGHNRADVFEAFTLCRDAGVVLRPSLLAFTPWTRLEDYLELVDWIVQDGLVDHLEPIQLAIRLLVPPGSALLWDDERPPWLGPRAPEEFGHLWSHPDARMDALYREVSRIVEDGASDDPGAVVMRVREAAYRAAGAAAPARVLPPRRFVPRLSEAWFCCAEPSAQQMDRLTGRRSGE
jgi:radical SAM superfamily enzyme YgiQ (UPF0313 family)